MVSKQQLQKWFIHMKSFKVLSMNLPWKNFPMKNFTQLWLKVFENQMTYSLNQQTDEKHILLWMLQIFKWTVIEKPRYSITGHTYFFLSDCNYSDKLDLYYLSWHLSIPLIYLAQKIQL